MQREQKLGKEHKEMTFISLCKEAVRRTQTESTECCKKGADVQMKLESGSEVCRYRETYKARIESREKESRG
jgi:hypothetical protein